ncbi:MAG TPA: LysM peptidoglycan-binding domain-containing protein [Bacteroidia bacterium]|nr:LysM peptidoglycan-binding domain-containing protein [Bacteroidia bacterium]
MICFPLLSDAATPVDSIGTETVKGNSFIRYQVGNGEGWYTIARKYGISYAELRLANKTQDDKLKIGQILLIPAKAKPTDPRFQKNYLDKFSKGTVSQSQPGTSTGSPVIHRVTKSETLYSIAKKYNASVEQVRLWNHLKDNSIRLDQALIVGYGPVSPRTTDPDEKKSTVVKKDSQVKNQYSGKSDSVAPAVTIEPRKVETVIVKTVSPNKPKIEERKQDNKYIFTAGRKEVNEQGVASWIEDEEINPNKYYALHRSAPSGTIIKITNRMNNKSIFVKVVGRLPDTGDNEGLIIKISKASAEKLGVLDQRFSAELIYGISEK